MKIHYEIHPDTIPHTSLEWQAVKTAIDNFVQVVPLDRLQLKQQPATPDTYDYEFNAIDGRNWNQQIVFEVSTSFEPSMTFDVTDLWKLSEFTLHRPIRDALITLIQKKGLIELDVKWLP